MIGVLDRFRVSAAAMLSALRRQHPGLLKAALCALLLALPVPEGMAVVLGEIRSSSRVGQIFHAEIEVDGLATQGANAHCLELFRPTQDDGDLPWLTAARLSYQQQGAGRGSLRIVSQAPVRDLAVQLALRSSCGDANERRERRYTVLLEAPVVALTGQSVRQQPAAAAIAANKQQETARPAANAVASASATTGKRPPAPVRKPAASQAAIALVAADGELALRLSDQLSAPAPSSELGRDLLRLERRTLQMLSERDDDAQPLSDKLVWLEADLAELKKAEAQLTARAALLSPSLPAPAVIASPPTARRTVPAAASPTMASESPAEFDLASDMGAVYAGGAALALLFSFLFLQRRRRATQARVAHRKPVMMPPPPPRPGEMPRTASEAAASAMLGPPPGASRTTATRASATLASMPTLVPNSLPTLLPNSLPNSLPNPAPPSAFAYLPAEPEEKGADPALELAEIMISFGRVAGAAKTLEEYLAANPKESLRPWIRLLHIYQCNGMRSEFEALSLKLNRNFNVEIMRWDDGSNVPSGKLELLPLEPAKVMALEAIPRLCDQVVALWGTRACVDFLERLLRDNRDGARIGFPLPVVEEILFLTELMAAREADCQLDQHLPPRRIK